MRTYPRPRTGSPWCHWLDGPPIRAGRRCRRPGQDGQGQQEAGRQHQPPDGGQGPCLKRERSRPVNSRDLRHHSSTWLKAPDAPASARRRRRAAGHLLTGDYQAHSIDRPLPRSLSGNARRHKIVSCWVCGHGPRGQARPGPGGVGGARSDGRSQPGRLVGHVGGVPRPHAVAHTVDLDAGSFQLRRQAVLGAHADG